MDNPPPGGPVWNPPIYTLEGQPGQGQHDGQHIPLNGQPPQQQHPLATSQPQYSPSNGQGQFAPPSGIGQGQFAPPSGIGQGQFAPPSGIGQGQFAPPSGIRQGQQFGTANGTSPYMLNNGYPYQYSVQHVQPPPTIIVTHNRSEVKRRSMWGGVFVVCFVGFVALILTLHFTGVIRKSYSVPYNRNETVMSPLQCFCRNLADCEKNYNSPYVTCSTGEICGSSVDDRGRLTKGCIPDNGNVCEFIYMNDYKARKPQFGNRNWGRSKRSTTYYSSSHSRSSKANTEAHHFCYCRTSLCNDGDRCTCVKNGGHHKVNYYWQYLGLIYAIYFFIQF